MATYRGTVVSFDSGTYRATIRIDGSGTLATEDIAVSKAIPDTEMPAGRRVIVDTGDHQHPHDFLVTACY